MGVIPMGLPRFAYMLLYFNNPAAFGGVVEFMVSFQADVIGFIV